MDDGIIGMSIREQIDIRKRVEDLERKLNSMTKIMLCSVDVMNVLLGDKIVPKKMYDKWEQVFKEEGLI